MATFEILPGLPPYGPEAEAFSAGGQGKHREGVVVRFNLESGASWVGNFQPACGGLTGVFQHPNGQHLIVVAGGGAYAIDPATRECLATFGVTIQRVFDVPQMNMLVFEDLVRFEALGKDGLLWRSDRVSWDGMRDVKLEGLYVIGEAWDPSDTWTAFKLNVETGEFEGGSYRRAFQ